MTLFTIGFTKKPAERFFQLLEEAGVRKVLDTRLHTRSQLSGFAKEPDLSFFLARISGVSYLPVGLLAPSEEMLADYRAKRLSWAEYEKRYTSLLYERRVELEVTADLLADACLLCSEHKPDRCHRRLAAEFLNGHRPMLQIRHLV